MKNKSHKLILSVIVFIILLITIFLTRKENQNEIISPLVEATEEPTPTPTNTPKYREANTSGKASFYDRTICKLHNTTYGVDCFSRDGTLFDDTAMVSACNYSWLGKKVRVCYEEKCLIINLKKKLKS